MGSMKIYKAPSRKSVIKTTYKPKPKTISTSKIRDITSVAKESRDLTSGTAMNTSAVVADNNLTYLKIDLTDIVKGNDIDQREGSTIHIKGVKLTLTGGNNGTKSRAIRLLVLSPISFSEGDVDATLTKIFIDADYNPTGYDKLSGTILYPINREKYKVYYDRTIRSPPETVAGGGLHKKIYKKMNLNVEYDKGGGTTAIKNKLYFLALLCEYDNTVSPLTNVINVYSRVYFRNGHTAFIRK